MIGFTKKKIRHFGTRNPDSEPFQPVLGGIFDVESELLDSGVQGAKIKGNYVEHLFVNPLFPCVYPFSGLVRVIVFALFDFSEGLVDHPGLAKVGGPTRFGQLRAVTASRTLPTSQCLDRAKCGRFLSGERITRKRKKRINK